MSANEVSNPIFARLFDRFAAKDRGRGEDHLRRELLAGLRGTVVEVGPGNGINFEHYPDSVSQLIAAEPEPYLRQAAERTARSLELEVRVVPGLAEDLALDTGSADAVVVAGVLCSVPDQAAALAEFRRLCALAVSSAVTSMFDRAARASRGSRTSLPWYGRG